LKQKITYLIISILLTGFFTYAQTNITINVNNVLNDVTKKPMGINVNYLTDDSWISPAPSISTTQALASMGVKFLRYPGGEKSDNYLWSSAPWTKANPKFARTGNCEWPSGDSQFAQSDWAMPKSLVLDFDEFMTMTKTINGEPLIVVAYDAMYKAVPNGCSGTAPTRSQLLTNAEEWVRYANIVKGYNIKYWMIGNESYFNCNYNGCATASQYRDDVIEFSQRMKAVDPTIKIIANGDGNTWWSTVLPTAASYIDFIGVSNYPAWSFTGGYTYYKNNTPNFTGVITNAVNAINSYAPAADRSRIKVIATEFNSNDWSGQWTDVNDLGHALVAFEILGDHLKNPKVESAIFWNTRWINNKTKNSDLFDALSKTNTLQPNGRAIAIWGNFLLDKMVSATSTTKIRSFASYKQSTNQLNVYLINKETTSQSVNVNLNNYISNAVATKWEFKGTGPGDTAPTWSSQGNVNAVGSNTSLSLSPASITVLTFKPAGPLPVRLVKFSAEVEKSQIILNWQTASETNNDFFTIEKSQDGLSFIEIYKMKGAGTVNHLSDYSFTDDAPYNGTCYYRLKQTDFDGKFTYSEIESVNISAMNDQVNIFPNPASEIINIEWKTNSFSQITLKVLTIEGKEKHYEKFNSITGNVQLNVRNWSKGIYFIQIILGDKTHTEKILVH